MDERTGSTPPGAGTTENYQTTQLIDWQSCSSSSSDTWNDPQDDEEATQLNDEEATQLNDCRSCSSSPSDTWIDSQDDEEATQLNDRGETAESHELSLTPQPPCVTPTRANGKEPPPRCDNQLEESNDHELGGCASEVPHDRLIVSDSPGRAKESNDHELGSASKVHHDRLTFWLTDEQIEEEKSRSRKPWRHVGGYSKYDTSGIDPKYGDHDYLIDVFLQSTFFRARSNKKIGVERLRHKWISFVEDVEHRIDTLDEDRRNYEDSSQGYNSKLHHMCLRERVPCAAILGRCNVCGPVSRRFSNSMKWSREFAQLSQELRQMISGSDDEIGMLIRKADAEAKEVAKMEEKPLVKFVYKHMHVITSDLNEWVAEVQDTLSTAVEVEETVNILRDDLEDLRSDFEEDQRTRDEVMENAIGVEVSERMETVQEAIDDAVQEAVESSTMATNRKIKRLFQKVTEMSSEIAAIKTQHQSEIAAQQKDIDEIKSMFTYLTKKRKHDSDGERE